MSATLSLAIDKGKLEVEPLIFPPFGLTVQAFVAKVPA
jgi:hypothetical protein